MGRRRRTRAGTELEPPAMGQGGSLEAAKLSLASAARESPLSAWRGLHCRSHFKDGETEAFAESLLEPKPMLGTNVGEKKKMFMMHSPSPGTCCGPGAVPGGARGLETHHARDVQTACSGGTGSQALPDTPMETGPNCWDLSFSSPAEWCLWPERTFPSLK